MRVKLAGLLAAAALWPSMAAAQDAPPPPSNDEPVDICDVITCTGPTGAAALYASQRFRGGLAVTPGAEIVLVDDQLARRQPRSLADVLRQMPGLTLSRSAEGTQARVRDAAPLVLIDGLAVNDPYTGGFDLAALPIDGFQRVEILTGPQSADWGDGASGGVIALQGGEGYLGRARLATSGDGGWAGQLSYRSDTEGRDNHLWGLGIAGFRTAGASQAAGGREKDAVQSLTAEFQGSRDLPLDGPDPKLRYGQRLTDTRSGIDGYDPLGRFVDAGGTDRRRSALAYVQLRGDQLPFDLGAEQQATLGYYRLRVDPGAPGRPGYDAERRTVRLELISDSWGMDVRGAALGLERTDTEVRIDGGRTASRGVTSIYLQALNPTTPLNDGPEDNFRVQGRLDLPDGYDPQVSLRLSDGWSFYPFRATASVGAGYSLPSLAQTLCDLCTGPPSPVALTPERTLGWDLTFAWTITLEPSGEPLNLEVTGFGLRRDNQIRLAGGAWRNIGGTRSNGLELRLSGDFGLADFKLRYVYTDARDDFTGTRPLGSPRHAAWLSAQVVPVYDLVIQATVRAQSDETDLDPSTLTPRRRDGFATADLELSYDFGDVSLYFKLENLTDARYQQTLGYGETGRAVWIGLRADFM